MERRENQGLRANLVLLAHKEFKDPLVLKV